MIPYAGDLEHNVGVVVEAIINSGSKAYGKIAVLATDYLTWAEGYAAIEKLFPEKRIALSKIDREQFIKLWREWGVEIADQMAWNDEFTDWKALAGERFFGLEELGIKEGEITTTTTTTVEGQLGSSNANGTGCIALGALLGRSLAGTALTLGLGLAPLLFPDEEADHLALVSGMLALHLEDLGLSHERSLGRRVHGRAAGAGNAAHIVVENIAHQVLIRNSKAKSYVRLYVLLDLRRGLSLPLLMIGCEWQGGKGRCVIEAPMPSIIFDVIRVHRSVERVVQKSVGWDFL